MPDPSPGREKDGPRSRSEREDEGLWERSSTGRARRLRADATLAEKMLWHELRDRKFHDLKFRRQQPVERYFADFACVSARVVIELDGWSHEHTADYDARRTEVIERDGWLVVRFTNEDVIEHMWWVLAELTRLLKPDLPVPPHPPTR